MQGKNRKGRWTLLHAVAEVRKEPELVQLLVDCGVDVNAATAESGATPILIALGFDNPVRADALIKAGADLQLTDKSGTTMLHGAARCKDVKFVKMFIEKGFDVNARDFETGSTPLMQACKTNNITAADLLLKHGAKVDLQEDKGEKFTALHYAVNSKNTELVKLLLAHKANTSLKNKDGLTAPELAKKQKAINLFKDWH
ncbi:MAG: ankyrin repeat domain-containing protein [Victivallaceae bacterium]|nr:ankyrin repeat domain-containing protein [Victivallaceae bacterium]